VPPARSIVDPIYAAIENHEKRDRAWHDLEATVDEAGLRAVKQRDVDRASAAAENAAWKMARTKPSTAPGAAALLEYVTTGPITGLFELGETHDASGGWCIRRSAPRSRGIDLIVSVDPADVRLWRIVSRRAHRIARR
jgi:hypothetical protein